MYHVFALNFREIWYGNYNGSLESIKMEHHMDFKEGDLVIIPENYITHQGQQLLSDSLDDLSEHSQEGGK